MRGTGTLLNVAAVILGTVVGAFLGHRFTERMRATVMAVLGLGTLTLGISQALEAFGPKLARVAGRGGFLVVLGSLLMGGLAGDALDLEGRVTRFGDRLRDRFATGDSTFTEGFALASLVFCVGPLAVLGSIRDGVSGDIQLLAIKSLLDGFASLVFASGLGWGVGFSAMTVLVYQGSLTAASAGLGPILSPPLVAALTATGGVMIIAIGLRLLALKEIAVANLLPALLIAPVVARVLIAIR
ncbi:MAG: DUF554 domain-containing protein [Actinomycetota bacterium]